MNKLLQSKGGVFVLLACAAVLIYAANFLPGRLDLTGEKRFTISQPAKDLLGSMDAPVRITVLLEGDKLSSGFKKLQNSTVEFLENCRRYSHNQLSYSIVDAETFVNDSARFPLNDTAKAEWLKGNAVKQTEQEKTGTRAAFYYPIALVEYKEEYAPVNLLQGQGNKGFLDPDARLLQYEVINNAEAQLEYNFMSAIQSLTRPSVPIVGYAMGNGEPEGAETYDLRRTLSSRYRFFLLNLQQQPFISDSIKALLIVKPKVGFSDEEKLKIDQYVMRGGHVLFLMDALNADMDSLVRNGSEFTAFSRNLNLDDLLFRYGARINSDLVQDKQSDVLPQNVGNAGGQPQIEYFRWPYFPLLYSISNHPVSKNLDAVVMQFPNSVDTVQAPGITKDILLSTSNTSRKQGAPVIVTVEILKELENASAYKENNIPLAVLLEGKFKSLYANRIGSQLADSLRAMDRPFLANGEKEGKILVTGDGDWVLNGFGRQGPMEMGENPYTQYKFANKDFLMNAVEYLTDENGLMASRSRQFTLRLLDPKKLEANKSGWQWLNVGLPLLLVFLAGTLFNFLRKRRYGLGKA